MIYSGRMHLSKTHSLFQQAVHWETSKYEALFWTIILEDAKKN